MRNHDLGYINVHYSSPDGTGVAPQHRGWEERDKGPPFPGSKVLGTMMVCSTLCCINPPLFWPAIWMSGFKHLNR